MIHQDGNTRGALRGRGFELRTDAYGALRAGKGLYLSTWPQTQAGDDQLEAQQVWQQLQQGRELNKTLSNNVSEQSDMAEGGYRPRTLSKEAILNGKMASPCGFSSNTAEIEVSPFRKLNAALSGRDDAGDATVPASSMHLESNDRIKAVMVIGNIEHGGSYNDELSRLATLYGICSIVNTHGAQSE